MSVASVGPRYPCDVRNQQGPSIGFVGSILTPQTGVADLIIPTRQAYQTQLHLLGRLERKKPYRELLGEELLMASKLHLHFLVDTVVKS